ncbi:MAG: autotransporter-associated beta strand repeat-containing protein, partial [Limisphaerales bacterium]
NPNGVPAANANIQFLNLGTNKNLINVNTTPTVNSILFDSAVSYTIEGNAITIGAGGITNRSFLNNTINSDLILNANQTWHANNGSLTFGGLGLNLNSHTLNLAGAQNFSFANAISGAGGLTKSGSGILSLNGESTYAGPTTISAGTLSVNNTAGSATGSGAVSIGNTARLTGSGIIGGAVTLQGGSTILPGVGVGQLTTGNQIWNGGSVMKLEINQANGVEGTSLGWDKLYVNGSLTLSPLASYTIDLTSVGALADFDNSQTYSWRFVETTGGITGFSESSFNVQLGNFANDTGLGDFNIFSDGNSLYLNFTPVPEPSTIALGVLGGAMVFGSMLRRRMKK